MAFTAGLNPEIIRAFALEALAKNIAFWDRARNADGDVIKGQKVWHPNLAAPAAIVRNRTVLPAIIGQKVDVTTDYTLDNYSTDPVLVSFLEGIFTYDKYNQHMGQDMRAVSEDIAGMLLYYWAANVPAAYIIRTKAASDSVAPHIPGATGNRRAVVPADFKEARQVMTKASIPQEGRIAVIDTDMLGTLTDNFLNTTNRDYTSIYNPSTGKLEKLEGFEIIEVPFAMAFSNAGTPAALTPITDGGGRVTDFGAAANGGALLYHPDFVERAVGDLKVFENLNDATMYGSY